MRKYAGKTPEEVMKMVSIEMIERAIKLGRKKKRTIYISKTAHGEGVEVTKLDPRTAEGRVNLEAFFKVPKRHYTIYGLGAPEEENAINWRAVNLPLWRRMSLLAQVVVSLGLKGTPSKNAFYRSMGAHIGRNTEIMQFVWLDHFRPELIFIGDKTLIGAYSQLTVHFYDGCGRFTYGIIQIGSNCKIGAGTGIGQILIEDNVRTLPGTALSPYLMRVRAGSVVGWDPPTVQRPGHKASEGDGEKAKGGAQQI